MTRHAGVIRKYERAKGFGFIRSSAARSDIFFHISDVDTGEQSLQIDAPVQFTLETQQNGPRAKHVSVQRHEHSIPAPGFNRPRLAIPLSTPEPVVPSFGSGRLPEKAEAAIAALLGFREPNGSPFAVGNALSKDTTFRAAVDDLYGSSKGAPVSGASHLLVLSLAQILVDEKAIQEPRLTSFLRAAIRALDPLFRRMRSGERSDTHAAVQNVLARHVRIAVLAGCSAKSQPVTAEWVPVTIATSHPASRGVVPEVQQAPGKHTIAPVESRPEAIAPPAPGFLVAAIERQRAAQIAGLLRPAESALDGWLRAAERVAAGSLEARAFEGLVKASHGSAAALQALASGLDGIRDAASATDLPLHEVILQLERVLALTPGSPIPSDLASPMIARETLRLATAVAELQACSLPAWVQSSVLGSSGPAAMVPAVEHVRRLGNDVTEFVLACSEWVRGLSADARQLLCGIASPAGPAPGPSALLAHLQRALASAMEEHREDAALAARVTAISDLLNPGLLDRVRRSDSRDDLALFEQAESLAARIRALQENVCPEAFDRLAAAVRSWPDDAGACDLLARVENAIELIGGDVSRFLPLEALFEAAAKRAKRTESGEVRHGPSANPATVGISVEHPLSRGTGGVYSADLAWVEQRGQGYGVISFPVRLKLDAPAPKGLTCTVLASSTSLLEGNHGDWKKLFPYSLQLSIPAGAQRFDFPFPLPVRKLVAENFARDNRNIALTITVTVASKTSQFKLEWQGLALELPGYTSPFPQTISMREMQDRPLGVERHFEKLLRLVEQGRNSFRVHGPRRFGKTTLVTSLCERFRSHRSVAVMDRVVASDKRAPKEVWREVAERLQKRFDRPVNLELSENGVPGPQVFDGIRREARARGIATIYVLIDEAQALFAAHPESARYGVALKRMLEAEWGRASDQEAALLLGLVGQAHLPTLMGADLLGAIPDEYSAITMDPDELVAILRRTGGTGLQSSAEARAVLARQAGNFWVLDRLLRRIADSCTEQGRAWFVEPDVDKAVERLIQDDQDGLDKTLWSYVRDVLNDNDDKNIWTPGDAFPVAMAWAYMSSVGGDCDPLIAIMEALEEWASHAGTAVDRTLVTHVFQSIKDQRVIRRDGSFELPLLRHLLAARAQSEPFQDEAERRSLVRLGLPRVAPPCDGEPDALFEGGQASVARVQAEDRDLAIRRVRLADAAAEQRFAREVALLHKISRTQNEHSLRARQHLPVVDSAGLDASRPGHGLVVYEWVDGEPLRPGTLQTGAAWIILSGLSEALCLLAQVPPAGVVHRDIRPDNIIVRRCDGEPVLVDFGLSIAVEEVSNTTMISGVLEYIPPEVKERGATAWTTSGDIYSLGKTIEASLAPGENRGALAQLLTRMTATDAAGRPSAREVLDLVTTERADLEFQERDNQVVAAFDALIRRLPAHAQQAVTMQRADFGAAVKGLSRERVAILQVAEFLENLTQALLRNDFPALAAKIKEDKKSTFLLQLSAMEALPAPLVGLNRAEARAIGLLRNAAAHPAEGERLYSEACRSLALATRKICGSPQLRTAAIEVAREIGKLFKVPELPELIGRWVSGDRSSEGH
jgi:serine/threonine protein kinase/cold shock CspA family protein